MLLRYLGYGSRHFGLKPMVPSARINWEFYAVVEGRCAPWLGGTAQPVERELCSSTLWVFPPEQSHGWAGERRSCRVVAFHFGAVPSVLAERARRMGAIRHLLSRAEVRRVEELAVELAPHYENSTELSPLYAQKALTELSLMALEGAGARLASLATLPQQKVEAAMGYFQEHLAERPSVARVARAAGVSPSHLRRLFVLARRESPRRALRRIALERAMELLTETDLTLEAVAERCGFAGPSEFSRSFKRMLKVPPAVWREGVLPPYQKPVRVDGGFRLPQDGNRVVQKLKRYGAVA